MAQLMQILHAELACKRSQHRSSLGFAKTSDKWKTFTKSERPVMAAAFSRQCVPKCAPPKRGEERVPRILVAQSLVRKAVERRGSEGTRGFTRRSFAHAARLLKPRTAPLGGHVRLPALVASDHEATARSNDHLKLSSVVGPAHPDRRLSQRGSCSAPRARRARHHAAVRSGQAASL